ncbi:magnesium/cobalt transporter CorA [Desulfogranum mediterraneum]|uniref:magnesium/cobalt transporter CorA n=1 Tax=Desulfogranum mediterraneum TaxID=160661 RepID=UPI0004194F33|nr:magnesium/cobalt transporter CorA [Desulfogranum mediterraneum]
MQPKKSSSIKAGKAPGTLTHVGKRMEAETSVQVIAYSKTELVEEPSLPIAECQGFIDREEISWIQVTGIHDPDSIDALGSYLQLHPLVLEDIMNSGQRPKLEEFDDYIFIVLKMLFVDGTGKGIDVEQVSLILGPGYVISFQESARDLFEPLRQRIRQGKGRVRKMGADYLAYSLMDSIVDQYFVLLEQMGEVVDSLEASIVEEPELETLQTIQQIKRQLLHFRRAVWPLREIVAGLQRDGGALISEEMFAFLRDLHDHTIQVMETLETFHMTISEAMDLYMSSLSIRMNQVAQILTIMATIFIPLTFISGVYGMNFKHMPELNHPWAYPACLLFMLLIAAGMILFFRRKRWL